MRSRSDGNGKHGWKTKHPAGSASQGPLKVRCGFEMLCAKIWQGASKNDVSSALLKALLVSERDNMIGVLIAAILLAGHDGRDRRSGSR